MGGGFAVTGERGGCCAISQAQLRKKVRDV
jgi:hypothetical protein